MVKHQLNLLNYGSSKDRIPVRRSQGLRLTKESSGIWEMEEKCRNIGHMCVRSVGGMKREYCGGKSGR